MRSTIVLAVVVAGCSAGHEAVIDRTDCRSCHTAPALTDPPPPLCVKPTDHASYPSTCADCHGTLAWCPADDNHEKFDITEDPHAGWDCADCHRDQVSYDPPEIVNSMQITCTSCHWHSADRTDPFHLGNGDYTYAPASCLESGCHGDRR